MNDRETFLFSFHAWCFCHSLNNIFLHLNQRTKKWPSPCFFNYLRVNLVFFFFCFFFFSVQRIGCYRDTARRAIPQMDGRSSLLRGNYKLRRNAIKLCALTAASQRYAVFGVQDGGWCASGPQAHRTFARYGKSNRCRNGKGGPWANDVYRVSGNWFAQVVIIFTGLFCLWST